MTTRRRGGRLTRKGGNRLVSWVTARRQELWHLRKGGVGQLREHIRRRRARKTDAYLGLTSAIPPWPLPTVEPRRSVRVAIIADDFTRESLSFEWDQVEITPTNWRRRLTSQPVDLLFIESAWAGNGGAWRYHLTGPSAPRPEVRELIEWCRANNIPTVLWNKEDPAHFDDFLDVATLVDWVFTTDEQCIERYRQALGHDRVRLLAFGVQEILCNPVFVGPGQHSRGVAFAGTYFAHKFPERREQMQVLFDAALRVEQRSPDARFDIYSRFLGQDERYQFPAPYDEHVVGSLSYRQMLSAYRIYRVFLNVNSVTASPTMCARRVLELTACGTPVVTTPTPAINWYVGEGAAQVSTVDEAERAIQTLVDDASERARITHLGQRTLWREHTFRVRANAVLEAVGLTNHTVGLPTVSAIISTKRPAQFDHIVDYLSAQTGVELQVLLGAHTWQPSPEQLGRVRELGLDVSVVPLDDAWSLGSCLNALKERADGDLVAKMDDDDIYGPHYLADMAATRLFSRADIVGKHERFVYLQATDETRCTTGGAQRFTDFVAGPTLTMTRDLARAMSFQDRSTGEDTGFLRDASAQGARIYASDPFNFIQWRSVTTGHHTWQTIDTEFRKARPVAAGLPLDDILI